MESLFILLTLVSLICFLLSWIVPDTFSALFKGKLSRGKIRLVFGLSIIVFFVLFGITSDSQHSQKNNSSELSNNSNGVANIEKTETKEQTQDLDSTTEKVEQVKYKTEREKAFTLLLDYKTREKQYENKKGDVIEVGATIEEIFRRQIASDLIQKTDGWFVIKDNDRYVVGWRGMRLSQFLNNPQWSIKDEKIFALNGTAKKYTPELGEVNFQENEMTNEVKFYLEWEALMIACDWDDSKNQINLDKVAKKWNLTSEKADSMFIRGQSLRDYNAKEQVSSMGEILTDEQINSLIAEQGKI